MSRNQPQINIRIPDELKDQLVTSACASDRSLTAEVVQRLAKSILDAPGVSPIATAAPTESIEQLSARLRAMHHAIIGITQLLSTNINLMAGLSDNLNTMSAHMDRIVGVAETQVGQIERLTTVVETLVSPQEKNLH